MKFRIFPNEKDKESLQVMFNQFRWYYNSMVDIFDNFYKTDEKFRNTKQHSYPNLRKLLYSHEYSQEETERCIFQELTYIEGLNKLPIPDWWEEKVFTRLPRGAVCKFTSSVNSAITNTLKSNKSFKMKFMEKKNPIDYLHFEDKSYPAFINKIKSHFWYRTKDHKRSVFSFSSIQNKRSLEIIYEKETDRYFLHTPAEYNYFPEDDLRIEKQNMLNCNKERIISLDPGVRKFLVGYDPLGSITFIGDKASLILTNLLLEIDKKISKGKNVKKEIRYVKNLVNELHWKTISFLIENYDTILLPDFRVQQMIRRRKLSKMTKRLLMMFSFHTFKERLTYKCKAYNKYLIIVDESFTSKSCGSCGELNDVKGNETFECKSCNLIIDRDVNGARNILLKNLK